MKFGEYNIGCFKGARKGSWYTGKYYADAPEPLRGKARFTGTASHLTMKLVLNNQYTGQKTTEYLNFDRASSSPKILRKKCGL